jgi:O-antigen ligase
LGLPIAIAAAVLLMVVWGRAASLDRLVGVDLQGEQRLSSLPTLMRMIGEYLPWGSGFGTFDPAFRTAEPDALLHYAFFNHAHDDAIEIILTGGIPTAALAIVVLGWWGWTSYRVFAAAGRTPRLLLGRAGSVIMALLGAASLSDYPLRTPLLGGVFLIAAYWLHDALAADRTSEGSSAGQHVAFS